MGNISKFNKAAVARLTCAPGRGEEFHWDAELAGFGLRCLASGVRRYVVQYRTKEGAQRRMSLGGPDEVKLDEAREKARELLARVRLGGDPHGAQQEARR